MQHLIVNIRMPQSHDCCLLILEAGMQPEIHTFFFEEEKRYIIKNVRKDDDILLYEIFVMNMKRNILF